MNLRRHTLVVFLFYVSAFHLSAQPFVPGQSYFGAENYIEYIAGNLPLIITAPHGGSLLPAGIPDRDCSGCSYAKDFNTLEMAQALVSAFHQQTGCYPHVIINHLHRRKLDANRAIGEAADGNPAAEQAWDEFHSFIQTAREAVTFNFGKGFYVDLHGHGHTIQRMELGYLLTQTELQFSDSLLNLPNNIAKSSIRRLATQNLQGHTHADLLRGPYSLGALLEAKGYPSVPSDVDPFPLPGEDYFNGGFNTGRYGSRNGGVIDGVQIECNYAEVRNNLSNVQRFADTLATALKTYLQWHYFGEWTEALCFQDDAGVPGATPVVEVFPNPACGLFYLRQNDPSAAEWTAHIYNFQGELLRTCDLPPGETIPISMTRQRQPVMVVFWRDGTLMGIQAVLHQCR